jgi:hypothetical protein
MESIGLERIRIHHDSRTTIKFGASFTDNAHEMSLPSAHLSGAPSVPESKDVWRQNIS